MATGVLARLQLAYSKMATSELAPQGPKPNKTLCHDVCAPSVMT